MILFLQRAFQALCFLFLVGCSHPICHEWILQEIVTKTPCFNGGRLILEADSDYSYLELELIRNRSGTYFYLNLLFLQALPCSEDPTRTRIEVTFENQEPLILYPHLLEGGQRILLPSEIADNLIQALLEDCSFTIQIGRSQIHVASYNFQEVYSKLLALPLN